MDERSPISRAGSVSHQPTTETEAPTSTSAPANENKPTSSQVRAASAAPTTKKLHPKRSNSASNSPLPSRETSPIRPTFKPQSSGRSSGSRSRQNSVQENSSPSRSGSTGPTTNPPSAAATQRVLSATSIPSLPQVASEPALKAQAPQKVAMSNDEKGSPRWPVSPRLRSPPPPGGKPSIISPKKSEQELSSMPSRTSHTPEQHDGKTVRTDSEAEEASSPSGMRTPARGVSGASSTLETVQEISQPNTPAINLDGAFDQVDASKQGNEVNDKNLDDGSKTLKNKPSLVIESGSDSGEKGELKMKQPSNITSSGRVPAAPKKSFSTTSISGRGKPSGEGSTRTMTVETETVSSIPQIAVGGTAVGVANIGSLRAKPSTETIRPKKDKRKPIRKPPSVTSGTGELPSSSRPRLHHHHTGRAVQGDGSCRSPEWGGDQGSFIYPGEISPERPTPQPSRKPSMTFYGVGSMLTRPRLASSKADIFEAKVASAVDEANSSDSEETFVYESNPPEVDRPRRFHSRTPSVTSMASQVDLRNGARSAIDGGHSVALKKSMKFASSYSSNGPEGAAGEHDGKGTARSNAGTGRGSHHPHISRWGRNGGNGHASLFDNESPFQNAAKSKFSSNNARHPSKPTSPRISNIRMTGGGKKSPISAGYDLDDAADDERTPLIQSSVRSSKSNRARRPASSMRQLEHQSSRRDRSIMSRFGGCLILCLMIILVISGGTLFLFCTSQPLTDVKVVALKNILASEQDIILDMKVTARNPNLVAVTIDTMDIVAFAKSKYAGTDSEWWSGPPKEHHDWWEHRRVNRYGNPWYDPPEDDPNASPNLAIGHVYQFESPLIFEGSPFNHARSVTLGELRIDKPGNNTVPRGSERWGRVLQHEFELIVRGTLKYTLPLSQKLRSVGVEGRVTVKPNAADQDPDPTHISIDEIYEH